MRREISAKLLAAQGYNPENTFACRDYMAGRITQKQMWSILNKNMFPAETSVIIRKDKPRKGELVILNDERHGVIVRVYWFDGQPETIDVAFNGDIESLDAGLFDGNYSTKGGPTHWYIYSDEYE